MHLQILSNSKKGRFVMKTKTFFKRLLPLILVLCIVFTACAVDEPNGDPAGSNTTVPSTTVGVTTGPQVTPCTHAETHVINQKTENCGVPGYTGDTVCKACGELISKGQEIPATTKHVWGEGTETKAPTCLEEGVKTITCTVCAASTEEPIAKVPHQDIYHDALDGTHNLTCGTCTAQNKNEAHDPVDNGTYHAATCGKAGYTEFTCSKCHALYQVVDTSAPALEHSFGEWTVVDSTCSVAGHQTRSCKNCTESQRIELPLNPASHSYEKTTRTESTCEVAGLQNYECTACHETKFDILPLAAHQYYTDSSEAATTGWTYEICSVCTHRLSSFDASDVVTTKVDTSAIPADNAFAVTLKEAAIQFPPEVVEEMKNAGGDVEIKAEVLPEETKNNLSESLSQEQKDRLNDVNVYDFSAGSNSFNAKVKVTIPYDLKEGEDPAGIKIWYLDDSDPNNVKIVPLDAVYDEATKTVTFEVEHFSYYAIAYEETQEMKCRRGEHDYKTIEVVEASCFSHGYTKVQCKCCQKVVLDKMVDMTAHSFGAVQDPHVDCENGGYRYKVCEKPGCGHRVDLEYVRALGHTPDQVATCTEASTCTTCKKVITPAKGHQWSEWVTVVEPTDVNAGMRRRNCPVCGRKDEVRLAPSGNVEQLVFGSYQEMAEALIQAVLGKGDGTVAFSVKADNIITEINISIDQADGSYVMLIDAELTEQREEGSKTESYRVLYRNGVLVVTENATGGLVGVSDIESMLTMAFGMMSFEDFQKMMEETFDYANVYVEENLTQARQMLKELITTYGDRINTVLKNAGVDYTAEDLNKVLDAVESVYAYMALKLGYFTNITMVDGVAIPTRAQLNDLLAAFCTAEKTADGNTTYTFDAKNKFNSAVDAIFGWFDAHMDMSMGDLVYELIGAELVKKIPELTSWAATKTYLQTQFPGTMTGGVLIDRLITAIESTGACTIAELYSLVDSLMKQNGAPDDFSIEAILNEYSDKTLDQICTEMMGCDLAAFYTQIFQMIDSTTLGSLPISQGNSNGSTDITPPTEVKPYGEIVDSTGKDEGGNVSTPEDNTMTVAKLVEQYRQMLQMFSIEDGMFKITLTSKGELVALSIDAEVKVATGEDDKGNLIMTTILDAKLDIAHKDVTVEIPSNMTGLSTSKVTYTYDKDGNLIVSGLDPKVDYQIGIEGNRQDVDISNILQKDEAMSKELGYDVFVLPKTMWNRSESVGDYILTPDGKYYTYSYEHLFGRDYVSGTIALGDVLADYTLLLPDAGDTPYGKYGELDVYSSALGYIYQDAGVWYLINPNTVRWSVEYVYDEETKKETYHYVLYDVQSVTLEAAVASFEISELRDYKNEYETVDGNTILLSDMYAYLNCFDVASTHHFNIVLEDGDKILLVEKQHIPSKEVIRLLEEVTDMPAFDNKHDWDPHCEIYTADGTLVEGCRNVSLYVKVPTYYVSYNGQYYSSATLFQKIENIGELTTGTATLPDGRTLYLLGKKTLDIHVSAGMITHADYGYLHVKDDLYIATGCFYMGETLHSIRFLSGNREQLHEQSGDHKISASFEGLVDLSLIQKQADGSYLIPASILKVLRAELDRDNESFGFTFYVNNEENTPVAYYHLVGVEIVLPEVSFGGGSNYSDAEENFYVDMYNWFGFNGSSGDYGPTYQLIANADGSVSALFSNGKEIKIEYHYGYDVLPNADEMVYDASLSEKYGLPIYLFNRYEKDSFSAVYQNGKYYEYKQNTEQYFTEYKVLENPNELITDAWMIESVYLFIDDPNDINANYYHGMVRFGSGNYEKYALEFYCKVENGVVMALTGVTEITDNIIRYEGTMALHEYLATLTIEIPNPDDYYQTSKLLDGTPVYYTTGIIVDSFVKEGEKPAELRSISLYFTMDENGNRQYIHPQKQEWIGNLILGKEINVDNAYIEDEYKQTYTNGTFNIRHGYNMTPIQEAYVKIAGKYYDLKSDMFDEWECKGGSFENNVFDASNLASGYDTVWYYVDTDGNKVLVKITDFDENGYVIWEIYPADEIKAEWILSDYSNYVGVDANGVEIYECEAMYFNKLSEVIDANTVFYYEEGMDGGYIGITGTDGQVYYVHAARVWVEATGTWDYTCTDLQQTIRPLQPELEEILANYMIVDGMKITFTGEMIQNMFDNDPGQFSLNVEVTTKDGDTRNFYVSGWEIYDKWQENQSNSGDNYGEIVKPK